MLNSVALCSENGSDATGDQKTSGLEVKIIKMRNPVALWSQNGTHATGDQKTSLEIK